MVDALSVIGIVGMIATALMVVGMLYLTFFGIQSDNRDRGSDPDPNPNPESATGESE